MKLDKEQLALKKQLISRGDFITTGVIRTTYTAESPLDEASRRMNKAREIAEQLAVALRRRH